MEENGGVPSDDAILEINASNATENEQYTVALFPGYKKCFLNRVEFGKTGNQKLELKINLIML